jgi:hypothetical protein
MLPTDLKDLLLSFNQNKVEYLVVGAYALGVHAEPRATKDLDIFIRSSEENSKSVYHALIVFGAPMGDITSDAFRDGRTIFQIGVEPNRIDILQQIDGVSFDEAWQSRYVAEIEDGLQINFISRDLLIRNKLSSGRLQDLADVEKLRAFAEATDSDTNHG